jgi:hypothetical protein
MSQESYTYWNNLRITNETQGGLSDIQPGVITGNIFSITDDTEPVLGYFDASTVSEKRVFFNYRDFIESGYKRPPVYRNGCYAIEPILVKQPDLDFYMNKYDGKMLIWELFGSPPTFELMPTYCCDCTDLGTNIKPEFWE